MKVCLKNGKVIEWNGIVIECDPQTFTCRATSSESIEQDTTDYKVDSVDHQQDIDNMRRLLDSKGKHKHFDEDEDSE